MALDVDAHLRRIGLEASPPALLAERFDLGGFELGPDRRLVPRGSLSSAARRAGRPAGAAYRRRMDA